MSTHVCPGRGCTKRVGSNELACTRCWRKLPAHLRNKISTSYRHDDSATHSTAVANAVAWYGSTACSPASSYDGGSSYSGGYSDGGSSASVDCGSF